MNIVPIIPYQGIHKPQQLARDGYQGLYPLHPPRDQLFILLVHNPTLFDSIKGCKVEQLPQQRPASFRDMPLSLMFSRAYLIEIKPRQFHNGLLPGETLQSPGLSYDPRYGNLSNARNREQPLTVGKLFQPGGQLRLYLSNRLLYFLYLPQKQPYLFTGALYALLYPYRITG